MPKLTIVKIGGAIIEQEDKLFSFLNDFTKIKGLKMLVHGGGKKASQWAEKMDIPVQIKDGRRITDAATLELISGLYAGQINKKIVASLQGLKCNAFGVSGADGNAITAQKRPVKSIDYGYVGDVTKVNATLFTTLLNHGITPVCCAITHDGNGQLLNTNADTITAEIGKTMANTFNTSLQFCFELPGVMMDINDLNSLITKITSTSYQDLFLKDVLSA